jgi:hypothetical protein
VSEIIITSLSTLASLSQFDLLTFTRDDLEKVLLLVLLKFEFEVLLSVTSPETMTEEEQIELAMTRSFMEFDREILKECSSTVAEDLLTGQGMESDRTTGSIVQSKKLDLVCCRVTNFHTEIKRFCTNGHF